MSRENVEVVRSLFEAFVTDGLDAAAERYLDDDAEYVEDPIWPGASSYRGRGEVVACFEGYTEALGGEGAWTLTVEKVVDGGERQAALVRMASQGSASGVPHEHLWGYTFGTLFDEIDGTFRIELNDVLANDERAVAHNQPR